MKVFIKRYRWVILPLALITALLVNNRLYYDIFDGYDMPPHFNNVYSLMTTGQMPVPGASIYDYEAHQAPFYYVLAAVTTKLAEPYFKESFQQFTVPLLLPVALGWVLILTWFVQRVMRHMPAVLKGSVLCVIALFPANVTSMIMFGNDLPVIMFGGWAAFSMWVMLRSGKQDRLGWWLWLAFLSSIAILFKTNGAILAATYGALAGYIVIAYCRKRYWRKAWKIVINASIGLPLMIIPLAYNMWHTSRYIDDPFGTLGETSPLSAYWYWEFFYRFDDTIFIKPWAYGPGEKSYWSMQYVTLHNDYYNHWNSSAYDSWPDNTLAWNLHRAPTPIDRYNLAIILQAVAAPVTLLIVFGFFYSLYRCLFKRRYALRDGSILVVLFTLVTQGAQILRFLHNPNVRAVVVHARYMGFLYPFLFVVGVTWFWRLTTRGAPAGKMLLAGLLAVTFLTYAFMAFKLMWLPPVSFGT